MEKLSVTMDQTGDAGKETIVCLRDQFAPLLAILLPLRNAWKKKSSVIEDLMLVAGLETTACLQVSENWLQRSKKIDH